MRNSLSQAKYNVIHGSFLVMNLIGFIWFCFHMRDIHFFNKIFQYPIFRVGSILQYFFNNEIHQRI